MVASAQIVASALTVASAQTVAQAVASAQMEASSQMASAQMAGTPTWRVDFVEAAVEWPEARRQHGVGGVKTAETY